jgi:REP element-mobilizing transposase RayT
MPRAPRIQYPDALYHVWTNGNRDCAIYRDADDREVHLGLIAHSTREDGWICRAYCQMTTHYHLLVQTPDANLDRAMHRLNSAYAHWFNKRHGYSGHLFKQRYGTELVLTDTYLLGLARYIVLNPVRARICRHPADWPWSSYRATAGLANAPAFLKDDWLLQVFGCGDVSEGRSRFRQFVDAGLGDGARHP